MKNVITITLLIVGFGVCLPVTQALAAAESDSQATRENAEQGWHKALETQVALAQAKLSLLQARTELWLEQNSEKAQGSLDEANASLKKAWSSADQVTRKRIAMLKSQVDQGKQLLQDKSQQAESRLQELSVRGEATLNAALVQAQAESAVVQREIATRYALTQAKASALKARVALEIDNAPERAQQALQEAESFLQQAKVNASEATMGQITQLQNKVQSSQQAIREKTDNAKSHISILVTSIEEQLQTYGKTIQESEEAKLLKRRYIQLEAKAALLKARLAEKTDATGKQAAAYLDESKAWYDSMKSQASQRWEKELTDMSVQIDEAKQAVERKDKQARAKLAELLEKAAQMINDEESAK